MNDIIQYREGNGCKEPQWTPVMRLQRALLSTTAAGHLVPPSLRARKRSHNRGTTLLCFDSVMVKPAPCQCQNSSHSPASTRDSRLTFHLSETGLHNLPTYPQLPHHLPYSPKNMTYFMFVRPGTYCTHVLHVVRPVT